MSIMHIPITMSIVSKLKEVKDNVEMIFITQWTIGKVFHDMCKS